MTGAARPIPRAEAPPPSVEETLAAASAAGHSALDEHVGKGILSALGIAVPRSARIGPEQKAGTATRGLEAPFVVKALSGEAIHKSDIGAVRLGLADADAVDAACAEISARMATAGRTLTGFLIEETAAPGTEVVIGGVRDLQLGPMIMIGAGGIYAEILHDVSFRLCPIDARDAHDMVAELKIAPILQGLRGRAAADMAGLYDALLVLGGDGGFFTTHANRVSEFDLNPVIVRPDGLTAVDCRIVLRPAGANAPERRKAQPPIDFRPLFEPAAIAVVGASATSVSAGNRFVRVLRSTGFAGRIFPIHPSAAEVEGIAAYRSLADMPAAADYGYLTVPADRAEQVLASAGGKLRFAQVMASGDPETRQAWEERLRHSARRGGFRIIGPNCMGTHSPRGRYTFMEGAAIDGGAVGIACQSGGLGMDILRRGQNLGLRFSGLVTLGNAIDVGPADLLEFYLKDPETKVVGLYIEDVREGGRFQRLARESRGCKPVVLLVGGVTGPGRRAAASHTGALAGTDEAWRALTRQAGMILTNTLDTFLDALQLCLWLRPQSRIGTPSVTLLGNGGGTSVLATDALDRAGFQLAAPTPQARAEYGRINLPPGASLENPIDLPASVLKEEDGRVTARILAIDAELTAPYATIVHLNLPVIMGYRHVANFLPNLIDAVLGAADGARMPHKVLVLRSDHSEEADAWRRSFREAAAQRGVPTFGEVAQAIHALAAFRRYEQSLSATDDACGGSTPTTH